MQGKGSEDSYFQQLLRAGVLGDGLGALRHGVLSQLSRQKETDSSLDLPRCYGGPSVGDMKSAKSANFKYPPLVVMRQLACLRCDPLEKVIDEGVHDGHGLRRDPSVWMNLLQDLRKSI